jgi:hypothetical protein
MLGINENYFTALFHQVIDKFYGRFVNVLVVILLKLESAKNTKLNLTDMRMSQHECMTYYW